MASREGPEGSTGSAEASKSTKGTKTAARSGGTESPKTTPSASPTWLQIRLARLKSEAEDAQARHVSIQVNEEGQDSS